MKKSVTSLICLATYCLGQTSAYAHGPHGVDTSLLHLLSEPQHAIGLLASGALATMLITIRNRRQTADIQQ